MVSLIGCSPLENPETLTTIPISSNPEEATLTPTNTNPHEEKPFRIIGYLTDGEGIVNLVRFDLVTHINYAFLIPNADGTLLDIANPWKLNDLVEKAHGKDVKVMISVGGWGWDEQFETMASSTVTRTRFVEGLLQFIERYHLDGADIDWEYPGPEPGSDQNFMELMRELRGRLGSKLLTAAVAASGSNADGILEEVFGQVDFLNLMAYDGPGINHSSYEYAVESIEYWSQRNLPSEKMVLGVPFYSRPGEIYYRKFVDLDPLAANTDQANYGGHQEYYNGIPTIQEKTRLALDRAAGIMIWTISYDAQDEHSLLAAIYQTAYPDR